MRTRIRHMLSSISFTTIYLYPFLLKETLNGTVPIRSEIIAQIKRSGKRVSKRKCMVDGKNPHIWYTVPTLLRHISQIQAAVSCCLDERTWLVLVLHLNFSFGFVFSPTRERRTRVTSHKRAMKRYVYNSCFSLPSLRSVLSVKILIIMRVLWKTTFIDCFLSLFSS